MQVEPTTPRVLSIGTDRRDSERLAEPLDRHGLAVETAVADEDLVARSVEFDCVVCRSDLGDTDGLSILRSVRERAPTLPFVLCPADGDEALASAAIEAGVSEYVPAADGLPADFADRVRRAVEARRDRTRAAAVHGRISDAFFAVDDDWRITHVNEDGAAILREAIEAGDDVEPLIGRPLWELVPEATGTVFHDYYREALETQEPVAFEEYYEATGTWFEVRAFPDESGLSIYFSDVTDRRGRIRDLRRYRRLVETVGDPMYVLDGEGYVELVNAAATEFFGADRDELVGTHASEFMADGDFERGTDLLCELQSSADRDRATYDITAVSTAGDRYPAEVHVAPLTDADGQFGGSVGVIRDLTERRERESKLAYRRALLEAQAATTVDGILVVDEDRSARFYNDAFLDLWDIPEAVAADRSEEQLLEYVRDRLADPEQFREQVDYLYEHPSEESRDTVELADGRWLDRYSAPVVHEGVSYGRLWLFRDITDRKNREEALARQRDELTQLDRLNTITREITRALQDTTTREAVETAVCDHLTESGLYQTTWIGTSRPDPDGGLTIEPGTAVGVDDAYLAGIPENEHGPSTTAIRTGEVQVVNDTGDDDAFPADRRTIVAEHDHHALAAVPLTADGTSHGVLAVYPPPGHEITERERTVLADLGRIIALSIQRVTSQRSLTADSAVEIRLRTADESCPFGRATTTLDCELDLHRWVPVDDGGLQYLTVRDADPAAVCDALERSPRVDAATPVRDPVEETGESVLLEVRLADADRHLLNPLVKRGASITAAHASDGETFVSAEVAPESDVRAIVGAVDRTVETVDLVSKRFVDRRRGAIEGSDESVTEQLTRKQEAALSAAYARGYFAWPRESTAEEVAETIGIASSTFHYHLRHAVNTLLSEVFERSEER